MDILSRGGVVVKKKVVMIDVKIPKVQDCPACHSKKLVFRPEDGNPHHGRLVCGKCGGYINWVSQAMAKFLARFERGENK